MLRAGNLGLFFVLGIFIFGFLNRDTLALGVSAVTGDDSFTHFDGLFKRYGKESGVPWTWLKAICMNESSLGQAASVSIGLADPSDIEDSVSTDGKSWGLMQLTLATARSLSGNPSLQAVSLNDPNTSVRLAAKLLVELIGTFGIDDRESVIRAYNGGPGFAHTTSGKLYTPVYYARFVTHLATVTSTQGVDEFDGFA